LPQEQGFASMLGLGNAKEEGEGGSTTPASQVMETVVEPAVPEGTQQEQQQSKKKILGIF